MTDPIRLAKRVAELRACSRREAEQIIAGGWVRVDGVVVEEPQFRVADQQIDIDAQANPGQTEAVTLLLHKPPGYFTHQDSEGSSMNKLDFYGCADGMRRKAPAAPHGHSLQAAGNAAARPSVQPECSSYSLTSPNGEPALQLLGADSLWSEDASGIRPLKMHFSRLTVCAPLETSASGLVVYTQDWRVARKLTEAAATVEHEIVVEVAGELAADGLKRLNQGITFNGRAPAAIKVSWQSESRLRVALKGAQPGQVAHMCEAVGLKVLALKRIRLGSMPLGKLPPGQWRYLRGDERF